MASIDIYSNSESGKEINQETVKRLNYIEEIEKIVPVIKYQGQIKIKNYSSAASFLLSGPGYISMDGKEITKGVDLSSEKRNGIVLSSAFLKILNKKEEEIIGEEVKVVLHIPETENKFSEKEITSKLIVVGVAEGEKLDVYLNLNLIDDLNAGEFSLIKIKTKNVNYVEEIKDEINILGYKTSSISEVVGQTKKFFGIISLILTLLGIIALMVSSIGMFNTMIITLLERTEEIGIMKSIGATDRNILSIFVVESALIGFLGGATGITMGFLVQIVLNLLINFIAIKMGGEATDLFYSPVWFMVLLVVVSLMIGVATGLIPARKASTVDPLEALKKR